MSKKSKQMRRQAEDLAERLESHVESARDKAAPLVAEAREKAGPALNDAKIKFSDDVLPVLTAALAAINEATEETRGEAKRRGKATAAALKGEVEAPKKKKHRLRRLLVVLGLGGVAAVVARKVTEQRASNAWQSSYSPTPASPSADDTGASTPDEAFADAAESPHPVTTPDNPLAESKAKSD
jgi:ElaB/YqjD/DUF883 family membrane-anchored ribosome-binding protein